LRKGQWPNQNKIRQCKDGNISAYANRNQQKSRQRKAGRTQQRACGVEQIPPGNFPMNHGCVEQDFGKRGKPEPAPGRQSAATLKLQGKDGAHLLAVLCPERGGI